MTNNVDDFEKFKLLTSYFQHEGSLYWARSNSFLVANSVLLALIARLYFDMKPGMTEINIFALGMAVLGVSLTFVWRNALRAAEFWIYHFQQRLQELEANVFQKTTIFSFEPTALYPQYVSAKKQAHLMLRIFAIAWGLLLIYTLHKIFGEGLIY